MSNSNRGNILFLILLAVVLFAALSYAVTSSMRGGGNDATNEQAKLYASQLMQYGDLIGNTINRLMLVNNCTDTQISFENSVESGYTNSFTPSDGRCKLFDPAGGGLTWQNADIKWYDTYFNGSLWNRPTSSFKWIFPSNMSIKNIGTGSVDIHITTAYLKDSVCESINTQLGLPYPLYLGDGNGGRNTMFDGDRFKGYYSSCPPSACSYPSSVRTAYNISSPALTVTQFCAKTKLGSEPEVKDVNLYVRALIER